MEIIRDSAAAAARTFDKATPPHPTPHWNMEQYRDVPESRPEAEHQVSLCVEP